MLSGTATNRRAFTVFEVVVAIAFLSVAMLFVLNMHRFSADYNRFANERLRKQLLIENIAERTRTIQYAELAQQAKSMVEELGGNIATESFETDDRKGLHLRISIDTQSGPLEHHVWKLEPES